MGREEAALIKGESRSRTSKSKDQSGPIDRGTLEPPQSVCLAGKDSMVRRLNLIHWTPIRMASPGLDNSVAVVFVSRCPPVARSDAWRFIVVQARQK